MADNVSTIGKKVKALANPLRDEGVGSGAYLEQITYLIFLKMIDEYSKPPYNRPIRIPEDCTWDSLKSLSGDPLDKHYKYILSKLGEREGLLKEIFGGADSKIKKPALLKKVITMVDSEEWVSMASDVKGTIYEELLKEYAEDTKSGAGQYFTPRALINTMVKCVRPLPNKTICDPACGTGGFLLSAYDYISNPENYQLDRDQKKFLKEETFYGVELVHETYRLCLMNLFLHGIGDINSDNVPILRTDSLLTKPAISYDYVLANPPFGRKSSLTITNEDGEEESEDLVYNRNDFWTTTSNKQLNFVQHIWSSLKLDGKAAIVVPDNVLFEDGAGDVVRKNLLEKTNLHTILRLPTGIFYKPGVKANVIFFDNKAPSKEWKTKEVWVYDFRTNVHFTLKQNPMTEKDLSDFVTCYNSENINKRTATYSEENPNGRWRKYTLDEVKANGYKLDLKWMQEDDGSEDLSLSELFDLIKTKANNISDAVKELEKLIGEVIE
jgi:type I restriction enzyme M protein